MKNYKKYILLLTLLSLPVLLASNVFANQDQAEPPKGEVWLYLEPDHNHGPFKYNEDVKAFQKEFDQKFSSVKVGKDTKAILYSKTGHEGKSLEITEDKDKLGNFKARSLEIRALN